MRFSRSLFCIPALFVSCCAYCQRLVVDDFLDGTYHKTFTGPGNFIERIEHIDPLHTIGGSRQVRFDASSGNPVTLDSREGRFAVDWQGVVTQQLDLEYGLGLNKIDLDLSWLTSFEIDRGSVPKDIYGTGYQIFLLDASSRGVSNSHFRGRPGEAIGFNRIDFTGSPTFDWSHVAYIRFQQEHRSVTSGIQGYRTYSIVAVPEPSIGFITGGAALLFARRRAKSRAPTT